MTGYSTKSLIKKLGIKPGMKLLFIHAPETYEIMLGKLPEQTIVVHTIEHPIDFIQVFVTSSGELERELPTLKKALAKNGMLWIFWPKGKNELNENMVREIGLQNDLVDVKVIAVDEQWSGLKFVYRIKDR